MAPHTLFSPSRDGVEPMFDRIAPRYDFLNRFLSARQDVLWREAVAKYLPARKNMHVLDLATGTADLPLTLLRRHPDVAGVTGIDIAREMLKIGVRKVEKSRFRNRIVLCEGDAMHLSFGDNRFDAATMAFGIRNVKDPVTALREIYRVVDEGGRGIILEFSIPTRPLVRKLYTFYFRHILPVLGGIVSGDVEAYRYLNKTVETFPYGELFCALMCEAGWKNVKEYPLSCGIATIYCGDKF